MRPSRRPWPSDSARCAASRPGMPDENGRQRAQAAVWLGVALAGFATAAVLSALSPPERSLGDVYRLVVFHGGLSIAAFAMLGLAGLMGLVALLRPGPRSDAWVGAGMDTAALYFLLYLVFSIVAMVRAWGGVLWEEPRFAAAVWVFFVGGGAYVASLVWHRRRVRAVLAIFVGTFAWGLVVRAQLFFHPKNPVRASDVVAARAFFYAIVAASLVSVVAFLKWRLHAWRDHMESRQDA